MMCPGGTMRITRWMLTIVGIFALSLIVHTAPQTPAPSEQELQRRSATQTHDITGDHDLRKLSTKPQRSDEAEPTLTRAPAVVRRQRTAANPGRAASGQMPPTGIVGGIMGGTSAAPPPTPPP